jgi:hypothetical protein
MKNHDHLIPIVAWNPVAHLLQDFQVSGGTVRLRSAGVLNDYLAISDAIRLDPGSYALRYELKCMRGAITIGVLDAGRNSWIVNRNHSADVSWSQRFRINDHPADIRVILAGANQSFPTETIVQFGPCGCTRLANCGLLQPSMTYATASAERSKLPPADDPAVIFCHIHKTAGISFTNLLLDNCLPGESYTPRIIGRKDLKGQPKTVDSDDPDVQQARAHLGQHGDSLQLFTGHAPYGMHRFISRPCVYLTFLRDPFEKCISHFLYSWSRRDSALATTVLQYYDYNLEKILQERAAYEFMNDQTRMICGSPAIEIGLNDLERAKEIIRRHFLFVGVTERYDQCIDQLGQLLFIPNVVRYRLNVQADKKNASELVSNRARELIRSLNAVDFLLYDWVLRTYLPQRLYSTAESLPASAKERL